MRKDRLLKIERLGGRKRQELLADFWLFILLGDCMVFYRDLM